MAHCRSEECRKRAINHGRRSQCCACPCQRCYDADAYGVHVHVHPYAVAATTSDGWPPVAPVVQDPCSMSTDPPAAEATT